MPLVENVDFGCIEVSGASAVTQHAYVEQGTSWKVGGYVGTGGGWWKRGESKVARVGGSDGGAIRKCDFDGSGGNLFVCVRGIDRDVITGAAGIGY